MGKFKITGSACEEEKKARLRVGEGREGQLEGKAGQGRPSPEFGTKTKVRERAVY